MRKTFIVLFLFTFSIVANAAQNYENGKLIFTDGASRTGLVETNLGEDFIRFKSSKDAPVEKIASEKIKTIVYLKQDNITTEIEFDRIRVYLGWKQIEISDYGWYQVVERGIVTLYMNITSMQVSIQLPNSIAEFEDYFVIREGEPAAKMIAKIADANNNQAFRAKAPLYFSDYPELAQKIESKEYTWKDLLTTVREYNKWAVSK